MSKLAKMEKTMSSNFKQVGKHLSSIDASVPSPSTLSTTLSSSLSGSVNDCIHKEVTGTLAPVMKDVEVIILT